MSSPGALKWLLLAGWLFTAGAVLAADQLVVITLQHRLAGDLVELIQPVLGESGVVSGRGDKLLVRGSTSQIEAVRALLVELDAPALSLLITVVQGQRYDRAGLRARFGYAAHVGGLTVEGGGVSLPEGDGVAIGGSLGGWRTGQRDAVLQRVRATSGYSAWISTGQSVPYRTGGYDQQGDYRDSVVFRQSDTGFSVLPQVVGTRVTLQIGATRARMDSSTPGAIVASGLSTRVTGVLGDWLEIGGVNEEVRQHTGTGSSIDRSSGQRAGQIWLRVQEIRQ